ncbi:MAG: YwiC-like family protein [Ilumatobacteraceae bacterium]
MTVTADRPAARQRSPWRTVALPTEHGGWGLTAEPVLLGLLVAFTWSGMAIGVAAFLAFLVRTPLKLALVDRRRGRSLERTVLAQRVAAGELVTIATLAVAATLIAGPAWLIPVAVAAPLIATELWFDVRSRGRRLIPELCGSIGIAAVGAAIVAAGDGSNALAIAVWLIVAGRALVAIPFVRTQIDRLRHGDSATTAADAFQAVGVALAIIAAFVDPDVVLGTVAVAALAVSQLVSLRRRHVPPATTIGIRQMVFGLAVVAATAAGVLVVR